MMAGPLAQLSSAAALLSDSPMALHALARTPPGLSGQGAAELLQGLMGVGNTVPAPEAEEPVEGVSRKDKSLGLLCDNFLQLFASGAASAVELEGVASKLGVGRRRIYDIVNVLESLDVVQKDRTSAYSWLGITKLPACVQRLSASRPIVPLLFDEPEDHATDKENATGGTGESSTSSAPSGIEGELAAAAAAMGVHAAAAIAPEKLEGRKEKSIRELSTKFVGLFLQAVAMPGLDGVISLEQAARSLLMHESGTAPGGPEPDPGAMKTKVRRLYDICNVLTSLRMIEKVKLPDTSKPAFKWLGVTRETEGIFDSTAAAARPVKAYGGGTNAPVCSKRARSSTGGGEARRIAQKREAVAVAAPAVVQAVPLLSQAAPAAANAVPCNTLPLYSQSTAHTVTSATAPTHEAIMRAQANLVAAHKVPGSLQANMICGPPSAEQMPVHGSACSPINGQRNFTRAQRFPVPTPAHVQAELLNMCGAQLENTPRAATAALLTMAAQRIESSEAM
uniref:E2F/DP family winged-helix DNA-binding domain-containing protein n=1 Tax=Haptolina brevifila TaxID=156173 RepID=A0A7S2J130_9EUKA|mmetsp:Transcript_74903/g.148851  ORF Transcript_74903/g.148851 Transcript_74903/m.148851 type:complete len:508 (+) Transcript_74903:42-1565(+)